MYVCMYVCMYVSMYVSMYVCMHVCMYVCMYVCIWMDVCALNAFAWIVSKDDTYGGWNGVYRALFVVVVVAVAVAVAVAVVFIVVFVVVGGGVVDFDVVAVLLKMPVNAKVITLDDAPEGYRSFDSGESVKYLLDPHGTLSKGMWSHDMC